VFRDGRWQVIRAVAKVRESGDGLVTLQERLHDTECVGGGLPLWYGLSERSRPSEPAPVFRWKKVTTEGATRRTWCKNEADCHPRFMHDIYQHGGSEDIRMNRGVTKRKTVILNDMKQRQR